MFNIRSVKVKKERPSELSSKHSANHVQKSALNSTSALNSAKPPTKVKKEQPTPTKSQKPVMKEEAAAIPPSKKPVSTL